MTKTHRLSLNLCPWCGYKLDAATDITGDAGPEPGDLILCVKCASPLQFDADNVYASFSLVSEFDLVT